MKRVGSAQDRRDKRRDWRAPMLRPPIVNWRDRRTRLTGARSAQIGATRPLARQAMGAALGRPPTWRLSVCDCVDWRVPRTQSVAGRERSTAWSGSEMTAVGDTAPGRTGVGETVRLAGGGLDTLYGADPHAVQFGGLADADAGGADTHARDRRGRRIDLTDGGRQQPVAPGSAEHGDGARSGCAVARRLRPDTEGPAECRYSAAAERQAAGRTDTRRARSMSSRARLRRGGASRR
jgi:hypothetical protein